jgi:tetratricopeptide (TPR) repeat protein
MLSFDGLAADIYWIRAIQHYGRDANPMTAPDKGKFELLQPLLDLTTTLDPHFKIAYRFGAIFLSLPPGVDKGSGPGRPDQAIALLEKALRNNPNQWIYAEDAGFVHYWTTGDFKEASRWFELGAAMPGAPEWMGKLAGDTKLRGGDRQGARELFQRLTHSEEKYIRDAAQRGLRQLDALDQIDHYQALVDSYYAQHHQYPAGWMQVPTIDMYPKDPVDVRYAYDPQTGRVSLSKESSLSPLPNGLVRISKGMPGAK